MTSLFTTTHSQVDTRKEDYPDYVSLCIKVKYLRQFLKSFAKYILEYTHSAILVGLIRR